MSEVSRLNELLELKRVDDELLSRLEALKRLNANPDFKRLILDGFCRDEAARYVQVSGDPNIGDKERHDALLLAQASGHLKRYLAVIETQAVHADRTRVELAEAIDEARREEIPS